MNRATLMIFVVLLASCGDNQNDNVNPNAVQRPQTASKEARMFRISLKTASYSLSWDQPSNSPFVESFSGYVGLKCLSGFSLSDGDYSLEIENTSGKFCTVNLSELAEGQLHEIDDGIWIKYDWK